MRLIYSESINRDEAERVETIFSTQKEQGVSIENIDYLMQLSAKSTQHDMRGKAFIVYNIGNSKLSFQYIKQIREEKIKPTGPIIEDIRGEYLKAKIYTTFMVPTLRDGDTGYFIKRNLDEPIMWGDIHLMMDSEGESWLCRVGQSSRPGMIKVYYDGSDKVQNVPVSLFVSIWQLKKVDRWLSQSL